MRATLVLRKGFWGRSMDEVKWRSHLIRINAQSRGFPPRNIAVFDTPETLENAKIMSDEDMGGYSRAHGEWIPPSSSKDSNVPSTNGHLRFHGNIDPTLPPNRPDLQRSGYAGWRTYGRGWTMFGRGVFNVEPYEYLAMRVKSDGRKYFINVQSDGASETDLYQHRLYTKTPGEWETVLINWNDFVLTNHGRVLEPQYPMDTRRLTTVGLSLIDRIPGPFDLSIERIWVCEKLTQEELIDYNKTLKKSAELNNKGGIRWNLTQSPSENQ